MKNKVHYVEMEITLRIEAKDTVEAEEKARTIVDSLVPDCDIDRCVASNLRYSDLVG